MKKILYKYPLQFSIVWALVIFILCATPGRYIPSFSWLEILSFDKFVHASMFFILCTLLFTLTIKKHQPKQFKFYYLVMAVAYGISLEIMQAKLFSDRSYDTLDIIANTFGCLMALTIFGKLKNLYKGVDSI